MYISDRLLLSSYKHGVEPHTKVRTVASLGEKGKSMGCGRGVMFGTFISIRMNQMHQNVHTD
jgi:hypothetical protein